MTTTMFLLKLVKNLYQWHSCLASYLNAYRAKFFVLQYLAELVQTLEQSAVPTYTKHCQLGKMWVIFTGYFVLGFLYQKYRTGTDLRYFWNISPQFQIFSHCPTPEPSSPSASPLLIPNLISPSLGFRFYMWSPVSMNSNFSYPIPLNFDFFRTRLP